MLIVNVPFIVSWFMMYRATSVVEVFIAYALLGFGVGLSEAPIITYIGAENKYKIHTQKEIFYRFFTV